MKSPVFISHETKLAPSWREAFPYAEVFPSARAIAGYDADVAFIDTSGFRSEKSAVTQSVLALDFKAVVLCTVPSEEDAFAMLKLGASGYAHKFSAANQLREILTVVNHGGLWVGPNVVKRLIQSSHYLINHTERDLPLTDNAALVKAGLSEREMKVAEQVARGATNLEIAESLGVSERTVKAHISFIFKKAQVRNRVELALLLNNIPIND